MKPDVKIEIIYYGVPADWSFESGFYGKAYALRLLTQTAANPSAFLKALDRAVSRSAVILTVGDLGDAGRMGLCSLMSRALGMDYPPAGGLPPEAAAFHSGDPLWGGRLESGNQAIYLLHSEKSCRDKAMAAWVFPDLADRFGVPMGGCQPSGRADMSLPAGEEAEAPAAAGEAAPTDTVEQAASLPPVQTKQPSAPAVQAAGTAVRVAVPLAAGHKKIAVRLKRTLPRPAGGVHTAAAAPARPAGEARNTGAPAAAPAGDVQDMPAPSAGTPQPAEPASPVWPQADETPSAAAPGEEAAALPTPAPEPAEGEAEPAAKADAAVFFGFDAYESAGKKSKKKVGITLTVILLVLVLVAGGCFGYVEWFQPWQSHRVYARMSSLYGQEGEGLPDGALSKFGALYEVNPDVAGWLTLPNTGVDYPVAAVNQHTAGYYESHLLDGTWNWDGCLYTGCVPAAGSYYKNITIYGRDTGDGRMLSDLRMYLDLDFYRSSPLITMDTLYEKGQWKIFSVFVSSGEDVLDYSQSAFSDDTAFLTYVAALADRSAIRTGVDLRADDEILTLVAKGKTDSVVLAARRVRQGESTYVNVSAAVENPDPAPVTQTAQLSAGTLLGRLTGVQAAAAEPAASQEAQTAPASQTAGSAAQDAAASSSPASSASSAASAAGAAETVEEAPEPDAGQTGGQPEGQAPAAPPAADTAGDDGELTLTVRNQYDGNRLVTAPASEIVAGIVEAEMGAGYETEALKAQSVAAYSWLLCNGAADGRNPQVYLKTPSEKVLAAVAATAGQRALYGDGVACTYYYAMSAGRTAAYEDIWEGGSYPYLVSVDSAVDKNCARYRTTVTYAAADVSRWLSEAYGLDVTGVDKNAWFQVTYDDYGVYARQVLLAGQKWIRGPDLRNVLFVSSRVGSGNTLRSSAYTISYDEAADAFTFTVLGYGHGVGMSQEGANAYAKQGWDYIQILQYYFPGITVE